MAFLDHVLQPPSYGWQNAEGELARPSTRAILREFFSGLNLLRDRKNWLPFLSWLKIICLVPFLYYSYLIFLALGPFLQYLLMA